MRCANCERQLVAHTAKVVPDGALRHVGRGRCSSCYHHLARHGTDRTLEGPGRFYAVDAARLAALAGGRSAEPHVQRPDIALLSAWADSMGLVVESIATALAGRA